MSEEMTERQVYSSESIADQKRLDRLPAEEAFQWAFDAMAARQWEKAAGRWATLRPVYPDQAPVWIQASISLRELGRYEEASELLQEARHRFPNHPEGWVQGANVAKALSDREEARGLLEEARRLFPDNPSVWLRSAELAFVDGDEEAARDYNQHVRTAFPDKPGGYIQHAEFAMQAEDWLTASERWTEVRKRFPELPVGYRRAAEALDQLGETRRAKRLRLACQYGASWLQDCDHAESAEQDRLAPMTRRSGLRFIELVWTKAQLNLKSEASKDQLHYFWWVIEPLMFMVVYYVVFALLLRSGGENYVAYLLSGVMPFQWFAKTIQHASGSIMQGRGLMQSVRVSPLFFPLVSLFQNTGKQIPVFVLLALLMMLTGRPPTIYWLALIPVIVLQFYFMAVLGCLLAMLIPFFRDLTNLVPIGIRFALFASGVFYTLDTIPDRWLSLFLINPMANLLHQYRLVLVEQTWPDWSLFGWLLLACVLTSLVVWWMYCKLEAVFPRVVIE